MVGISCFVSLAMEDRVRGVHMNWESGEATGVQGWRMKYVGQGKEHV